MSKPYEPKRLNYIHFCRVFTRLSAPHRIEAFLLQRKILQGMDVHTLPDAQEAWALNKGCAK